MIVRSVGERTSDLCFKLIEEQGINEKLFITQETPFSAALREAYKIGISEAKPWTFCVDADLLLRPESINTLIQFAQQQKPNVFEVQGLVYDKFFNGPRQAGNHLYRTSLLPKAIDLIPEEGVDIRPESYVLRKMKSMGYPWVKFPFVVGLHDYEQFYTDIYRKSFIQAYKHLDYADIMIPHWKENQENDKDFEIALLAFTDGILNSKEVFIDKDQTLYREKFKRLNYKEKGSLDLDDFNLRTIENRYKSEVKEDYQELHIMDIPKGRFNQIKRNLRRRFEKYGVVSTLILNIGLMLIKMGKRIRETVK